MKKRLLSILLMSAMTLTLFGGCGSGDDTSANTSGSDGSGPIPIRVVTSATYEPFCYVDENNEITGFEVDVIKAIDEAAPEIECSYEYADWSSMLPGLDSDRYDVVVYQIYKNAEREAVYHYGSNPYYVANGDGIIASVDHADWKTYEDIPSDATIGVVAGGSYAAAVESYLEEHPNAFQISYYDSEIDAVIEDIANGRVDATINDSDVANAKIKKAGLEDEVMVTGITAPGEAAYCLFADTDKGKEYSEIFDKYIEQLYYDGTLSEIAIKWFGNDNCIKALGEQGFYE